MRNYLNVQQQEKVNTYFQSRSSYWKDIYTDSGVYAEIHRDRHIAVLDWIDSLALPPTSQVLEIGCGAGFLAIALAQRGFRVHAIDSIEAMVDQARQHAIEADVTDLLSLDVGSVYSLSFDDEAFDLVVAIGVIPWLDQPELAIQEVARVTKPGGYAILTADNRSRMNALLDPWLNPALSPLKRRVKVTLEQAGIWHQTSNEIDSTLHKRSYIDRSLARFDLVKTRGMTLGFGPFSLFRRTIVPEPLGTALHHRLQRLADRGIPIFRSAGAHYLVLARKSASQPLMQTMSTERPLSDATITR